MRGDADARSVNIRVDPKAKWIEIIDDGIGMTIKDMNDKYLRVGYRRREEDTVHGKQTAKGRTVMGRKGLGKLSLFSIAKLIKVQSAKDGQGTWSFYECGRHPRVRTSKGTVLSSRSAPEQGSRD